MKAFIIGLLLLGLTSLTYAQQEAESIPEIKIHALNSDYINAVYNVDESVNDLEKTAASFDVNNLPELQRGSPTQFMDSDGNYHVKFANESGNIVAVYDTEGTIMETYERFKNTELPRSVLNVIGNSYPEHSVKKDIYFVRYNWNKDTDKKYKILLVSNEGKSWIKIDENGNVF